MSSIKMTTAGAALISLALLAIGSQLSEATVEGNLMDNYGPASSNPIHPYILSVDSVSGDHAKVL